jgi:hypothetical protein
MQELKAGLQDSNWFAVCKALAVLQQLTAHHHDVLSPQLYVFSLLSLLASESCWLCGYIIVITVLQINRRSLTG